MATTMTVDDARAARNALRQFAEAEVPVREKVRIHRQVRALDEALEPYDDTWDDLVRKHGQKGRIPADDEGAKAAFFIDWAEIAGDEIEVDVEEPISVSTIADVETEADVTQLLEVGLLEDDLELQAEETTG